MRPIEERCAMTFISDRAYDVRTAGEKMAEKRPIGNALLKTLTDYSTEREFRRKT